MSDTAKVNDPSSLGLVKQFTVQKDRHPNSMKRKRTPAPPINITGKLEVKAKYDRKHWQAWMHDYVRMPSPAPPPSRPPTGLI